MPTPQVTLALGDCRHLLDDLPEASVSAIVCDPPYELAFMGKAWDASGVAFDPQTWAKALRVLKPGGHLLAFGGARTHHRMMVAIEDAGFEIRDCLFWAYGTGFPKSHDVSKAIDKSLGATREVVGVAGRSGSTRQCMAGDYKGGDYYATAPATPEARQWAGWGSALKPSVEPIILARKPFKGTLAANVLAHGVGGLNVDACRIPGRKPDTTRGASVKQSSMENPLAAQGRIADDGLGRWPSNLLTDGSDEIVAAFPDAKGAVSNGRKGKPQAHCYGDRGSLPQLPGYADSGSAARFFPALGFGPDEARIHYCPKASKADRGEGNTHATVKPTSLMRWLVRLITPPGGIVLDPFMGSGSTGKAAVLEGFDFIGFELGEDHMAIARRRIDAALAEVHEDEPEMIQV